MSKQVQSEYYVVQYEEQDSEQNQEQGEEQSQDAECDTNSSSESQKSEDNITPVESKNPDQKVSHKSANIQRIYNLPQESSNRFRINPEEQSSDESPIIRPLNIKKKSMSPPKYSQQDYIQAFTPIEILTGSLIRESNAEQPANQGQIQKRINQSFKPYFMQVDNYQQLMNSMFQQLSHITFPIINHMKDTRVIMKKNTETYQKHKKQNSELKIKNDSFRMTVEQALIKQARSQEQRKGR